MKQTFKLPKGEICFDDDRIIVTDDAKRQKWTSFSMVLLGTIYFIQLFLKSLQTGISFDFWVGLLFCVVGILTMTTQFFRSVRREIPLNMVKSMKIRQAFNMTFLEIKLANYCTRRVNELAEAEALEKFITTHFDTK